MCGPKSDQIPQGPISRNYQARFRKGLSSEDGGQGRICFRAVKKIGGVFEKRGLEASAVGKWREQLQCFFPTARTDTVMSAPKTAVREETSSSCWLNEEEKKRSGRGRRDACSWAWNSVRRWAREEGRCQRYLKGRETRLG